MSRVHDALRRAEQSGDEREVAKQPAVERVEPPAAKVPEGLLDHILEVPYSPSPDSYLIDPNRPHDAHSEEFRTLRTRLNHMQKLQPIHAVVVTSASPAEGKSFTAVNLALSEAQLSGNLTLLADFDLRRPMLHKIFQVDRAPGITDYLQGKVPLSAAIRKLSGTNLYFAPAGESVINPLELLNLSEARDLFEQLPSVFNWVLLDSPPLLFAADANLLSTMADGTIIVVRVGSTTIDSVKRAMQTLCENNVLGVVANGARKGELYSKYTYYYSSYYYSGEKEHEGEE